VRRQTGLLLLLGALIVAALLGGLWLLAVEAGPAGGEAGPSAGPTSRPPPSEPVPGAPGDAASRALPQPLQAPPPQSAAGLSGRAVDRARRAVSGARVLVHLGQPPGTVRGELVAESASDDQGRFLLTDLPSGRPVVLELTHEAYAPTGLVELSLTAGEVTELGDLVLTTGVSLSGMISDTAGNPLADALVGIEEVSGERRPATAWRRQTHSDATGQYVVEHLAARQYQLGVQLEGYESQSTVVSFGLGAPPESWRQDFRLGRADSRLGGLLIGPDDRPVPLVDLRLSRRLSGSNSYVLLHGSSDAEGSFRFESLAEGTYRLELDAAEHYVDRPPDLESGRLDHVVRVQRARTITGWLSCEGELPTAFTVTVRPDGRTGAGLLGGRPAERAFEALEVPGRFLVGGLRPGAYRLEVRAPGWAATTSQDVILAASGSGAEVVIPLRAGGSIQGRIAPAAAGARVELRPSDYDPTLAIESLFPTTPVHGLAVETDDRGGFQLEHVPEGTYTLSIHASGAAPLHLRNVAVVEQGLTGLDTITLESGGSLAGTVFGPDGFPRAGVRVSASGSGHHRQQLTVAGGAFRMENLPPGTYSVRAVPGALWEALRFDSTTTVEVRPDEETVVTLTLSERAGAPR
jgi:hypothetical protein